MKLAELVEHALALPPSDRLCLLEKLDESLIPNEGFATLELAHACAEVVERRSAAYVAAEDWEVVRERLR